MRSTWPAINHTLLSPSGHASKRARKALEAIEYARLFPPGYWDVPAKSDEQIRTAEILRLRRSADNLRDLAARGMNVTSFLKHAARLDNEAMALSTR